MARWGMPGPPQYGGQPVTNIRNVSSPHWRGWLGRDRRCVVPATSFCEYADTKAREIKMAKSSGYAIASIRGDFANVHLRSALRAARNANEAERSTSQDEMIIWVPVAVVMSGAALEASANELIQDIIDGKTTLSQTETEGKKDKLSRLLGKQNGNAVIRYREIAELFNRNPTETAQWQNAWRLVQFRNAFMHFRPVFYPNSTEKHRDLVKELKDHVPMSKSHRAPEIQFPYSFMCYDCAKWSIETVLAFSAEFATLLGVKDKFRLPGWDFSLP